MALVKCTTKATGTYVTAQAWVTVGGERVDFKSGQADLPTGTYELKWFFIADPGATVAYSLDAKDATTHKAPCTAGPYAVRNGEDRISSGKYRPPDFKPAFFEVP